MNDVLWPGGYQGGDIITIQLVEDDHFADDDWGDGSVGSLGEFNSIIQIVGSCAALGDPNAQPCDEDPFNPGFTVTSHITLYMHN